MALIILYRVEEEEEEVASSYLIISSVSNFERQRPWLLSTCSCRLQTQCFLQYVTICFVQRFLALSSGIRIRVNIQIRLCTVGLFGMDHFLLNWACLDGLGCVQSCQLWIYQRKKKKKKKGLRDSSYPPTIRLSPSPLTPRLHHCE